MLHVCAHWFSCREHVVVENNTPAMADLITVNVTDGDQPNMPNSEVTLEIVDSFGGLFAVMGHTIVSQMPLSNIDEYEITIIARDGGTPQLTSMAMFTIEVINANEHPPMFNIMSEISFTENENNEYTFTITDDDSGNEGTAMLPVIYGEFASDFSIAMGSTANEFVLETVSLLDREQRDNLTITLTVSDNATAMFRQTATVNVTIIIVDVNDNAPVIENLTPDMIISVAETSASGHFIYQVSATDADSGTNAELVFNIESATSGSDFPFDIDDMGQINTTRVITDTTGTVFNAIVTVTDGGSPMRSANITVIITVTEANENKPVFSNLPGNASIDEDAAVNDIVIQDFIVTDDDSGEAGTVNVELEQSANFFTLIGNSIFLNQEVDYEVM